MTRRKVTISLTNEQYAVLLKMALDSDSSGRFRTVSHQVWRIVDTALADEGYDIDDLYRLDSPIRADLLAFLLAYETEKNAIDGVLVKRNALEPGQELA